MNIIKKVAPTVKKIAPKLVNILSSIDLLENTTAIAKPFVEDVRNKNIEKSKRIHALQAEKDGKVIISMEKAGILVIEKTEEEAFKHFIYKLINLKEKRILSDNKKIRREQLILIEKINSILSDGGNIEDYIYRILVKVSDEDKRKKFSRFKGKK